MSKLPEGRKPLLWKDMTFAEEQSRIIQHWYDRGYRVVPIKMEFMEQ